MNLKTNEVVVFPAARRVGTGSNKLSEKNIILLISNLLDAPEGFVISKDFQGEEFEFIIQGYYFAVKEFKPNGGDKVYAKIKIKDGTLLGQDDDGSYTGLDIVNNKDATEGEGVICYYLTLAEKDESGNYVVPKSSMLKYNIDNVFVTNKNGNNFAFDVIDGIHR